MPRVSQARQDECMREVQGIDHRGIGDAYVSVGSAPY